ncbi:MAG: hypothetical protein ACRDVE_19145, partial [Actinocrinis sp.]
MRYTPSSEYERYDRSMRAHRWCGRRAAAVLALACLASSAATACDPASQDSGKSTGRTRVAASSPAAAAGAKTCGVPPCDQYLSRGRTRDLNDAVSGHPVLSAVAMHLVVSAFCGGILCIWGEGFTFVYVQGKVHQAAQNGQCLRVHILPQGREWQIVSLDA